MKIPDAAGIVIDGFPRDIGQALSFEDQVCFLVSCCLMTLHTNITHSTEHAFMSFITHLNTNMCDERQ